METALIGICLVDGSGQVLSANQTGRGLLGLSDSNLVGTNLFDLLGMSEPTTGAYVVEHDDGTRTRILSVQLNRWSTQNGDDRVTVIATDITELKMVENEALSEQNRFRGLAENASDMIVTIGVDRIRRYVSPASERILGFTPEEMVGESPLAGIHPDDRAHTFEVSESLLRGAKARICRYRHLHKDGHYVWLEASFRTISDPVDGKPIEFVGTVRDISDRDPDELAEAERFARIEESNRLLEMAEQMANIGHWRVDLVGGSVFWSDQVYRIHGLELEAEVNLQRALEFYHEDDREKVTAAIERAVDTAKGFSFKARIVRTTGEVRHVASLGQVEVAAAGETIGIFGVFEDITDTVVAQEELRASRDRAEAAMRAKAAFLANMSHEIRTPMNGVIGFADLLLASELTAEQRDQLQLMRASGDAMLRLLNDLLDLSKIEAGHMELTHEPFDVSHVIRSTVRLFQPTAKSKRLRLTVQISNDVPQRVMGDAMRVRQVMLNLIGNAIKFTDHGSIRVSAGVDGDRLQVLVADTGIGIQADRMSAIFEDFAQADAGVAATRGGTGLGLSISRRLVELMGGEIGVESEVGRGATFYFHLPLHRVPDDQAVLEGSASTASSALPEKELAGRKVLIAEDNDINQTLIRAMVERLGIQVDMAADGAEAVAMVQESLAASRPYDLVLMDIQMPQLDGYAATMQIRASGLSGEVLPIVALTANAYPEDIQACLDAGMQAHIAKPVKMDKLTEVLETWILRGGSAEAGDGEDEIIVSLRPKYEAFKRDALAQLDLCCDSLPAPKPEDIAELGRLMHKLGGTAAVFGDDEIGDLARELEDAVEAFGQGQGDGNIETILVEARERMVN